MDQTNTTIISNSIWSTGLWTKHSQKNGLLGQHMSPEIKDAYTVMVDHFCTRALPTHKQSITTTRDVMHIMGTHDLNKTLLDNFSEQIDIELRASGVCFPVDCREVLLHLLPVDIPCNSSLEIYEIGREDPREELVGEKGVRASIPLPPGAFIGVYRGKAMLHSTFKKWKLTPPLGRHPIAYEIVIDSYAAATTLFNLGDWANARNVRFPGMSVTRPQDNSLVISAAQYGNITSIINDPHLQPMEDNDASLGENVDMFEIVIGAWPFLVMFTTKAIEAKEDLRYNYGAAFWDYFQEHSLRSRNWETFVESKR